MKNKLLFTVAVLISTFASANTDSTNVQINENDTLTKREFQVSFITPLGTNGMDYNKFENKISLNIFAGHHGGLNGIEVGGFANSTRYDARGIQLAGFVNIVQGKTTGTQGAGFVNYTNKLNGVQASGFCNVSKDSVEGGQFAGFVNYAHKNVHGIQAAGFSNVVYGNLNGIQSSGFSNVATGKVTGLQVSGFSNTAKEGISGLQVSGFFNYAKTLKGVQVGFINYNDSIEEGLMIGFLSYSRTGYHKLEIEGNESLYGNVSFKTGVNKFYNIFSAGAKVTDNNLYWSFGYGIGSIIEINKSMGINIDLTASHVNKDSFTSSMNLLTKLKPSFFYQFHKNFTVYGGPSINLFMNDDDTVGEDYELNNFVSNSFYNKTNNGIKVKAYFGFQGGLRF
tara:strand:+ start:1319 stop:2503 length:1185 start_codon:yes stop_codon:yes gene_type:complete